MDKVKKVLMMINLEKENILTSTQKVIEHIAGLGIEVLLDNRYQGLFPPLPVRFGKFADWIEQCDLMIALGGDGTILHCARHAIEYNKPVLGINAGRLGFLAAIEPYETDKLTKALNGECELDRRMILEIETECNGEKHRHYSINDVVVTKGALSRMIDLEVSCNERKVNAVRADGMIIATPTGSTAYSLSAGGPVTDPSLECIIMTAICPHSLLSRAMLFSGETVLNLHVNPINCDNDAYLTIDGQEVVKIDSASDLVVRKSERYAEFVTFHDKAFYEILNEKMLGKGEVTRK